MSFQETVIHHSLLSSIKGKYWPLGKRWVQQGKQWWENIDISEMSGRFSYVERRRGVSEVGSGMSLETDGRFEFAGVGED